MLIVVMVCVYIFFFFFKQKTAYEMRISDWSSDVCSSDLQLVSGQVKARRVAAWAEFARAHPDGYLYCFRGGLRSQISQAWLKDEAGIEYPRVIGGYKAMRGFLLQTIEDAIRSEEHTSELQSLMRISYAVFCLKKKHLQVSAHC